MATVEAPSERSLETLALSVGAAAFAVTAVAALLAFRFQAAPIAGPDSLGQFVAISSAVVAILAFVAGRYLRRGGGPVTALDVVDVAALAFAHAVIALLTWTLLADILDQAFTGAEVFAIPLVALAGAVGAVTAYIVFFSATHLDLQLLAIILAVFLVQGILASALTASDPGWWHEHLSALGATNDVSALAFNLTLIVAGVIVTTLARYATRLVAAAHPHEIAPVRTCLILIGVFLANVGVFPVDTFFWIHTAFASGMGVVYGVLVVRLPRWIPGMSRVFYPIGWIFLAVIAVLVVFYVVGYYTLTAVELVAGVLVFAWIVLFIRNAGTLQATQATSGDTRLGPHQGHEGRRA